MIGTDEARRGSALVAYSTYVPYWRLRREEIARALGTSPGGGSRAVASYDEDAVSMGVEAARAALRVAVATEAAGRAVGPPLVLFASASPPYRDKTNATAIHAALGVGEAAGAYDVVGSIRGAFAAMRFAAQSGEPALVVLSDVRTGLAGGADEAGGGDAAAAFAFGAGAPLVDVVATSSTTREFLDRWRVPGESASHAWEERFGEHAYAPLAERALADACERAGVTAAGIDHLVVAGPHDRAVRRVVGASGVRSEAVADQRLDVLGNTGTAHPGILLADALDRARPGELIAWVVLADGCDVALLRATDALAAYRERRAPTTAEQLARGRDDLGYATFLSWRGMLDREPPRRPDPERPAAPPSLRAEAWKYAFTGSRCEACGTRHLPPARVCVACAAVDRMRPEPMADARGTVTTFTVDRLAFSQSPPVVAAVIDFEGGGRFRCELTDVDPGAVAIGDRVEMTFRRQFTAGGVHNYFFKAKPTGGR